MSNTSAPQLQRRLGVLNATTINMSNMVGIGPFITVPLILATLMGPQAYLAPAYTVVSASPKMLGWRSSRLVQVTRAADVGVRRRSVLSSETEEGLEGCHWGLAAVVSKHELIEVNLKLSAAHAVVRSGQPLLQVANGTIRQRHHRLGAFPQVSPVRLRTRDVFVAGLFEGGKGLQTVCVDGRAGNNVLGKKPVDRHLLEVWNNGHANAPGALPAFSQQRPSQGPHGAPSVAGCLANLLAGRQSRCHRPLLLRARARELRSPWPVAVCATSSRRFRSATGRADAAVAAPTHLVYQLSSGTQPKTKPSAGSSYCGAPFPTSTRPGVDTPRTATVVSARECRPADAHTEDKGTRRANDKQPGTSG